MTIYDKKEIMRLKVNYEKSLIKAFFTFDVNFLLFIHTFNFLIQVQLLI